MAYQLREGFRRAAQSTVNAINTPERLRLAAKQEAAYDEDRAAKASDRLRQKAEDVYKTQERAKKGITEEHRLKAGELFGQGKMGTPEFEKELYLGEGAKSVIELRKLEILKNKKDKPDRFSRNDTFLEDLAMSFNNEIGDMFQETETDGDNAVASQQQAIAKYDSMAKTLSDLSEVDAGYDASYSYGLSKMTDKVLAKKDESQIGLISTAVTRSLASMKSGDIREFADLLEENKSEWSAYGNTAGIPSNVDIANIARAMTNVGGVDKDSMKKLLDVRDPKGLSKIIQEKDTPKPIKIMAMLILKKAYGSKAVGVVMEAEKKATEAGKKASKKKSTRKFEPDVPLGLPPNRKSNLFIK